jgi:hypothetical protein
MPVTETLVFAIATQNIYPQVQPHPTDIVVVEVDRKPRRGRNAANRTLAQRKAQYLVAYQTNPDALTGCRYKSA